MDFRAFVEPHLQGAGYSVQLAAAQVAEAVGFEGFFRSDHYLRADQPTTPGQVAGPTDSWITLAGLARETRTIRLGTLMSAATLRQPGPLAIQVAQVDDMSGGRVELGLGTGWQEHEHRTYGIDFPDRRFDRLEEQLRIVTGLWSTPVGGTFDFSGEYYRLEAAPALRGSSRQPRPPLIVGGIGARRTPALAARYADEYNVGMVRADRARAHFDGVRQACAEVGRDPSHLTYSVALTVCCGADDAEVLARAHRMGRGIAELRATGLTGSPAQVVDKIGAYREAGVQRLYFQFGDLADLDHLELVGQQVLPQFA